MRASAAALARVVSLVVSLIVLLGACETDGGPPPPTAPAAGPVVIDTTSEEATVRIRIPEEAALVPGLAEALSAEAQREAADLERRAAERRREAGESAFTPSELIVNWTAEWSDGEMLSLLRRTRLFEGGFTTVETRATLLVERATGRRLGFGDLFADPRPNGEAMTAVAEAAFAAWETSTDQAFVNEYVLSDVQETLRPRAGSFSTFTLVPAQGAPSRIAGVELLYPEGQLGPRTDGPRTLFIPAEALAPHLAPDWIARMTAP